MCDAVQEERKTELELKEELVPRKEKRNIVGKKWVKLAAGVSFLGKKPVKNI